MRPRFIQDLALPEWRAELHQQELLADWQALQEGKTPEPIEPLK